VYGYGDLSDFFKSVQAEKEKKMKASGSGKARVSGSSQKKNIDKVAGKKRTADM
jgi:hypothetical protein